MNCKIKIHSVTDPEFKSFGRVIDSLDTKEIIAAAKKIECVEKGSVYIASEPSFECLDISKDIRDRFFGTLPTQVGYCYGHSNKLNAAEWHASNEINIAITPLILFLGHVWDLDNNKINSDKFMAFYVPEGTVLEVYSTSLHFCPCEVEKSGFGCVVALPEGTNVPLDKEYSDKLMFRKNKWIISHYDNAELIARGVVGGIDGENFEVTL